MPSQAILEPAVDSDIQALRRALREGTIDDPRIVPLARRVEAKVYLLKQRSPLFKKIGVSEAILQLIGR
jgi:hypothetical protein